MALYVGPNLQKQIPGNKKLVCKSVLLFFECVVKQRGLNSEGFNLFRKKFYLLDSFRGRESYAKECVICNLVIGHSLVV